MKNNKKGFASIILIGIIIVLVAIAGYFALKAKQQPVAQPSTSVTTQAETSTSIPNSKDETTNWKTYSNTQFGFQFKYPSDLKTPIDYIVGNGLMLASGGTSTSSLKLLTLSIQEKTGDIDTDIKNYKSGNAGSSPSDCLLTPEITYTTIANEKAVRIDCGNSKSPFGGNTIGSTAVVDFYHGNYKFIIGIGGSKVNEDVLGEIIKNFSFSK